MFKENQPISRRNFIAIGAGTTYIIYRALRNPNHVIISTTPEQTDSLPSFDQNLLPELVSDLNKIYLQYDQSPEGYMEATAIYTDPIIQERNIPKLEIILPLTLNEHTRTKIMTILWHARQNQERPGRPPLSSQHLTWLQDNYGSWIFTQKDGQTIENVIPYEALACCIEAVGLMTRAKLFANPAQAIPSPGLLFELLKSESNFGTDFNSGIAQTGCLSATDHPTCAEDVVRTRDLIQELTGIRYPTKLPGSISGAIGPSQLMPTNAFKWINFAYQHGLIINIFDVLESVIGATIHLQRGMYDAVNDNPQRASYWSNFDSLDDMQQMLRWWNNKPEQVNKFVTAHQSYIRAFPNYL